ncbi:MAG TPA: hypothetical protein VFI02_03660 [Armatimonadota bacterium]|nr:hypothetical protein [Armatimonadota bacterium]
MTDVTTKKLGVRDRLVIPNMLPGQGGIVTQRVCKDIRKKVQLTQEEMTLVNMRDIHLPNGQSTVQWDTHKVELVDGVETRVLIPEPEIDVDFTGAELKIISEAVARLDKQGKITPETLETCEKFLDPQPGPDEASEETA